MLQVVVVKGWFGVLLSDRGALLGVVGFSSAVGDFRTCSCGLAARKWLCWVCCMVFHI